MGRDTSCPHHRRCADKCLHGTPAATASDPCSNPRPPKPPSLPPCGPPCRPPPPWLLAPPRPRASLKVDCRLFQCCSASARSSKNRSCEASSNLGEASPAAPPDPAGARASEAAPLAEPRTEAERGGAEATRRAAAGGGAGGGVAAGRGRCRKPPSCISDSASRARSGCCAGGRYDEFLLPGGSGGGWPQRASRASRASHFANSSSSSDWKRLAEFRLTPGVEKPPPLEGGGGWSPIPPR
mmetsp:Transcript_118789/g.378906  ORF Transcript_118789/g.378906 Transcript_118789/m.378906 type:complete len:240 (-) Transcript_118789:1947-2666(-)